MLRDTFFTLLSSEEAEKGRIYRIFLHPSHPVFQAHFAGHPIMPGACIVQIVKELAEDYFGRSLFTTTIRNTKFLRVINPLESQAVSVKLVFTPNEEKRFTVTATLFEGEQIFAKATLTCEITE